MDCLEVDAGDAAACQPFELRKGVKSLCRRNRIEDPSVIGLPATKQARAMAQLDWIGSRCSRKNRWNSGTLFGIAW